MKLKLIKSILIALVSIICLNSTFVMIPAFANDEICDNPNISDDLKKVSGCPNFSNDEDELPNTAIIIINSIISISGLIAVIFIVIGGIKYMTSSGESGKVKVAKDTILYACIGLIICVLAFAIVNFLANNIIKGL